jgi:hypothetical protein
MLPYLAISTTIAVVEMEVMPRLSRWQFLPHRFLIRQMADDYRFVVPW